MNNANFTTIPIRGQACAAQTHKTLDAIRQSGGLACACGTFTKLDADAFLKEIEKTEANIKDFGAAG